MSVCTRVIRQADAEIIDIDGRCLVDLFEADNPTVDLIEVFQLAQEVPETELGDNAIGSKDSSIRKIHSEFLIFWETISDLYHKNYFVKANLIYIKI